MCNSSDPFGLCPPCGGVDISNQIVPVMAFAAIKAGWGEIEDRWNEGVRDLSSLMAVGAGLEGLATAPAVVARAPIGDDLFRVYGGGAKQMGRSWATANPEAVAGYAAQAGLPAQNTMTHMVRGILTDATGVRVTKAAAGARGAGGIAELVIPDPKNQIVVTLLKPYNPK